MINKRIKINTSKTNKTLVNKWREFKENISNLDDIEIIPKNNYISLMFNGKTLCYLIFRKNSISLEINRGNINTDGTKSKNYFDIDDPKGVSNEGSWEWKSGTKGTIYKIPIDKNTDLEYLMFLIKQKYNNLSK